MSSKITRSLLLVFFSSIAYVSTSCVGEGHTCSEDCDCCDFDTFPPMKCETRNHMFGNRCYKSYPIGVPCMDDMDCRSQICGPGGVCIPRPVHPPPAMKCEITAEVLENVIGTRQENICGCPVNLPNPTTEQAVSAFDGDLSSSYVNNYALNGGFIFKPLEMGPLRYIEICSADDCPECDPTCYELEGLCADTMQYELIQAGSIDLPLSRSTCISVSVGNRPFYNQYKLTFPCQRGGCKDTCGDFCRAEPLLDPAVVQCPGYVDDGVNNLGTLDYISHSYDAGTGYTTFIYSLLNIDVVYMALSWSGECSISHYYVYEDLNGNKIIDTNEICCFRKCGVDFVSQVTDDLEVCMSGLELWSSKFATTPGLYLIQLLVLGEITNVQYKQYAVYGNSGQIEYGQVLSPVCPDTLCPATCPLKVSEVNFMANCRDITGAD